MKFKLLLLEKYLTGVIVLFMVFSSFGFVPLIGGGDQPDGINSSPESRLDDYERDVLVDQISVDDYFIVPNVYANKHYPGQNVSITTKIWNLGTKSIITPFDVLMVILDDVDEANVKYEVHMKQTVPLLPATANNNVTLNWNWVPPSAPPQGAKWDYATDGGHTFKVRVISLFEGDQNSSNNFNSSQIDIENPKFAPSIQNRVWEVDGPVETNVIQLIPIGSILYLNFTVNNTATSETDFIKVDVPNLPEDWVVMPGSLPPFLQLQGGRGVDIRLRIQISRDNSLALKAVDYPVYIVAYSLYSPPQNYTFEFTVNLEYSPLAKFILPQDVTLQPGSHLIDVTLVNIGNGVDNFICTAEVFPADETWSATVYSGAQTKMLLTFEQTTLQVRVDVPPKRKDFYKTIIVKAQSVQNPSYDTGDNYDFKVYVGQYYGVGLRLSDEVVTPLHMRPSDEYSFELILTNAGNTKDPTIDLQITDAPPGWEITLEMSNVPKSGLGIGADVDVGALVKTPEVTLMGDYTFTISGMAGNPLKEYDKLVVPVEITEVGKVSVESNPPGQSGNIGDIVQYKIQVQNTGNRLDTFDLYLQYETEGMFGWGKLSQNSIGLEANESYEIVLTVTIPLNASADTNPNTPSVWEGYGIRVFAKSQNLTGVYSSVLVTTNVNQFYDFDLSADATIKPVIKGINEPVPFLIRVKNRGNVKDTFEFVIDSKYKWSRLLSRYKSVKPGDTQEVKFEANAPEDIGVGVYEFTILVSSQGDVAKFREIELKVFVSSLELSLQKIKVDGKEKFGDSSIPVTGGNTVLIEAQVKNTGSVTFDNVSFPDCSVVFFDGRKTIGREKISYLPIRGVVNVSISWNATTVSRDLTIFVNLDPDEDISFSSRNNLSSTTPISIQGISFGDEKSADAGVDFGEYLPPFLFIIILIIIQALSIGFITRTKKSRIKVGYSADGEYKPFADVFDPFAEGEKLEGETDEEHPYRVAGSDIKGPVSIEAPERPLLPPASYSVSITKPVIKTIPLPRTNPVRRRPRA